MPGAATKLRYTGQCICEGGRLRQLQKNLVCLIGNCIQWARIACAYIWVNVQLHVPVSVCLIVGINYTYICSIDVAKVYLLVNERNIWWTTGLPLCNALVWFCASCPPAKQFEHSVRKGVNYSEIINLHVESFLSIFLNQIKDLLHRKVSNCNWNGNGGT